MLWLAAAALMAGAARAESDDDYPVALGVLYAERYAIQAFKDVCIGALPAARREYQSAYDDWFSRHEEVVEDLKLRVAAMVKGVSRDEAEYSRNFNEYHNAVMRQRAADKKALRSLPRDDLVKRCRDLPGFLRSAASDMYNTHPKAFGAIYGRKQP